jgi:hypothetical protein
MRVGGGVVVKGAGDVTSSAQKSGRGVVEE